MTICPFCKKAVVNPDGGPCPSCGKVDPNFRKAAAPAAAAGGGADGWDELDIQHGSGSSASSGPSSYSGGTLGGLGSDDDDNGPGLSLELDAPQQRSLPPQQQQMSHPPPQQAMSHPPNSGVPSQQPPRGVGASGGYPKYSNDPMPQPLPPRSGQSAPQMVHQQSSPNMAPPPSQPVIQQPQFSQPPSMPMLAPGQPDPAAMIARYPTPPTKVWESPMYAMRVLWRQYELRQDIASLKARRSPDVPLYERALKTHDGTHLMIGIAITLAALTVATFITFLPVIIRFATAPD